MEREEISRRLVEVLEEASAEPLDQTVGDETTIESLGFDSLSILDVIYGVEQEFDLEIDAEEVVQFKTVGELVTALAERL